MGVATKRKGVYSRASGYKRRKDDEDDDIDDMDSDGEPLNYRAYRAYMEADFEPEGTSSDEGSGSDETEEDLSRVTPEEIVRLGRQFGFTDGETTRVHHAYNQTGKISTTPTIPLQAFVEESYRYINMHDPGYRRSKCTLACWLQWTPAYLDVMEDRKGINPDAPLESQAAWIHQHWSGKGKDSRAHMTLLSILRSKPRPELVAHRGREGNGKASGNTPMQEEARLPRPKRQGTGKPRYVPQYHAFETEVDDEDSRPAEKTRVDSSVEGEPIIPEDDEESVSASADITDDDEELGEHAMEAAIEKALFAVSQLESLEHLGSVWKSMTAIKAKIKRFVSTQKVEKAFIQVLRLKEEGESAMSQTIQGLSRPSVKSECKVEEREMLRKLARQGDSLAFIRELTKMETNVRDVLLGLYVDCNIRSV